MSWCTSGVGLQVLPVIDNRHLGSIHHFQRFSCWFWDWKKGVQLGFYWVHCFVYTVRIWSCCSDVPILVILSQKKHLIYY